MGFSKKTSSPEITVAVTHRMHPGDVYEFDFPKRMPQPAVEAEQRFLGLKDDARPDELRRALIEAVAALVLREPRGLDDFPGATCAQEIAGLKPKLEAPQIMEEHVRRELEERLRLAQAELSSAQETPLAERFAAYFDDPEHPELEQIISSVWSAYRAMNLPGAYLKSVQDSGAGSSDATGATAKAESGV